MTAAFAHISGKLKEYSSFVSTAQNVEGFVTSDNKVAQSVVRSPENYDPSTDFSEFPKPAATFQRAPYFGLFLIPVTKLITPQHLRKEAPDQDFSTVDAAGEHLFFAPEGMMPYLFASISSPF